VLFWYFRNEDIPLKKRFSLVAIGDIIAVVFFSFLAQKIHTDTLSFAWLDTWFQQLLVSSPLIDSIMLWVDKIFNMWFIGVIGIGILLYLYRKKLFYYFTVFASSVLCSLFAFPLLKLLIQRARPPEMFLSLHDFSFPSGHATMSIVFCLLCWYVFQRQIKQNWKRYSFLFLMICCTLLIGASRLFLYVHWFTDVLAGFLLGFAILATNILVWSVVFKKHVEQLKVVKKRCKKLLMDALL
jgi:undecaprenyl-diphosphatase